MNPELDAFERRLFYELERVVGVVASAGAAIARTEPLAGANSINALATHALGAAESHVVRGLCGLELARDRAREFSAPLAGEALRARLDAVKERIHAALTAFDPARLGEPREGDERYARDWLTHAIAHAAEHAGQAELTRDLLRDRAR